MRKKLLWTLLGSGLLSAGLIGFGFLRGSSAASRGAPTEALVRRVVNGHYLRLDDREELVLAGMRTPYSGEPLHQEARKRAEELVEGKIVHLEYEKKPRDSEGRLVAYVRLDGVLLNEVLVREGLGFVQAAHGEKSHKEELLGAQSEARARRSGVWGVVAPKAEASYVADSRQAVFHRPGCKSAASIRAERQVIVRTRDDAVSQGFAPCRHCTP